jgi:dTDP-glucose 4,6-dehydratase
MKYLVTGGAGFIGSNFVRFLLRERTDTEVVNLDALSYAGNKDNLAEAMDDPRHRFIHGDICDPDTVSGAIEGVDIVVNLAAESHVDRSIASDRDFVRTNVLGTATLLASALASGVKRFVQVSTDEVYGELPWAEPESRDSSARRFTEDTPLAPRSPYSATKAAADHLSLAYHITHGLDVVVTRSSNNYGPNQHPEKLIPLMITNALQDKPLPVYGDGLHVRDWLHVKDHCRGLIDAVDNGAPGRILNFGGDAERTNLSVVKEILQIMDRPSDLIQHVQDRFGHDRRYAIDSSRAQSELGWEPSIAFSDGLRETVDWYVTNQSWWKNPNCSD